MINDTPVIFKQSKEGRKAFILPNNDISGYTLEDIINKKFIRKTKAELPTVSESQIVRHFINLSVKNHHVDKDFYPLGSCTMKYNPKINDAIAMMAEFAQIHPEQNEDQSLQYEPFHILFDLQESMYLRQRGGFACLTALKY